MNPVRREPFLCLRPVLAVLFLLTSCASVVTRPLLSTAVTSSFQLVRAAHQRSQDDAFLEDLEHRSFNYFWEQADPQTGLVPDRARIDGSSLDENHRDVASIAATGFGLTALCIGSDRGWITQRQASERARNTLRFFANQAFQQRGWFYHWLDAKSGERRWKSEVSSIDTALLLAGVLTVREKFANDKEIVRLATEIYERADFKWMLNGHPTL